MEFSEKIFRHRDSLEMTFGKFKNDVDNIIDDTKHIIIDVEEIEDDFKHCYKKCCYKCFFYRLLFLRISKIIFFFNINIIKINKTVASV